MLAALCRYRPPLLALGFALVLTAVVSSLGQAQPPRPDTPRASALRLPDGTIVLFTKNPDDPNPPIEGVLLSPQEFKNLTDLADQAKKAREPGKAQAPSSCQVKARIETRGERTVALLTLTYAVRTSAPRTPVALGGQKAFPTGAKLADGKLPLLTVGDEGLTALIESPGDHIITVDLESPVGPRGPKGEVGFEVGLARAAITTLAIEPPGGIKKLTLTSRLAGERPGDAKVQIEDVSRLTKAPYPLGPLESLIVSWEVPSAPTVATEVPLKAEADVTVRVDDAQIETTISLRLHGPAREWSFALPPNSDVAVARASTTTPPRDPTVEPPFPVAAPSLQRPTDPAKPLWVFRPPEGSSTEWVVTAVARQTRPKATDPKHRGPYTIGPIAVPTLPRLAGTLKLFAPVTVRVTPRVGPDLRRQEAPPAEDDLVASYKFVLPTVPGKPFPSLLELEARPDPGFVRMQPSYQLRRTEGGWRLEATVKVNPVRTEVEQLTIEVPTGWQTVEAAPAELVEVQLLDPKPPAMLRPLGIRLITPQKAPFDLSLTALFPVPPTSREVALAIPRFLTAEGTTGPIPVQESAAKVTATVPDGLEVRGSVVDTATTPATLELRPGTTGKPTGAVTSIAGQTDGGVSRVELAWQPYRPDLTTEIRTEVSLQDRQATVSETLRIRLTEGDARPMILRGPAGLAGLRAQLPPDWPPLETPGPGEWIVRPPANAPREFSLKFDYALPIPPRRPEVTTPVKMPIGLLWPEAATRVETSLRVWGVGSGRRIVRFEGPWREFPPEPAPDRDTLPWLTLGGSGGSIPLTLELADPADGQLPPITVTRSLIQAWVPHDGPAAVWARFLVRNWSAAGVDLELPPGIVPDLTADGRKLEAITSPGSDTPGSRTWRLVLPEPRAGQSVLTLDIRYFLPPAHRLGGEIDLIPPRFSSATFSVYPEWQVLVPPDSVPLCLEPGFLPELRWKLRHGLPAPVGSALVDEWEPGEGESKSRPSASDTLSFTQPQLVPVRVFVVGWTWWVTLCSLGAFAIGFSLSRLRPILFGPALGLLGVGLAVTAVVWPEPMAQAASGSIPGLAGVAAVLGVMALVRWYYRRRVSHLPGFTLTRPDSVPTTGGLPAVSTGSRTAPSGSGMVGLEPGSGGAPFPPAGG